MIYRVPSSILSKTFGLFRACGCGQRECQVLWTSPWHSPEMIDKVVHPSHGAHFAGFELDGNWLNSFWVELSNTGEGVRVQVHTHPGAAFHSSTDDHYPIVHSAGFLSLVIPGFGLGRVGFEDAYLAERNPDGKWCEVPIPTHLQVRQ